MWTWIHNSHILILFISSSSLSFRGYRSLFLKCQFPQQQPWPPRRRLPHRHHVGRRQQPQLGLQLRLWAQGRQSQLRRTCLKSVREWSLQCIRHHQLSNSMSLLHLAMTIIESLTEQWAPSNFVNSSIHKFYREELTFRDAKATAPGILHHRNASGGNSGNVSDSSSRRYEYNQP